MLAEGYIEPKEPLLLSQLESFVTREVREALKNQTRADDESYRNKITVKMSVRLKGNIISHHTFHYFDPLRLKLIKTITYRYSDLNAARLIREFKRTFRISKTEFLDIVGISKKDYNKVMTLSKDVTQELLDTITLPLAGANIGSWIEEIKDGNISSRYISNSPIDIVDIGVK